MKTDPDFVADPDVDVRQARYAKHTRGPTIGAYTYSPSEGVFHAKRGSPIVAEVSQSQWWVTPLLTTLSALAFCHTVSQCAGIYDYRNARYHVSKVALDLADLGTVVKRRNSTLLRKVWSTGVLFVRPAKGDHRFDLWPRAPGGRRILPPRISKRSLDALVSLARSASWRVPSTWGTHVDRVLDRPPLEAIPAIKNRLKSILRCRSRDNDRVKPLSVLSACNLSTIGLTYQQRDSAGHRISGESRKPTRKLPVLVKRQKGEHRRLRSRL
jgi:hypothetical protein